MSSASNTPPSASAQGAHAGRNNMPDDAIPMVLYVPKDVHAEFVKQSRIAYTGIVDADDAPKFALSAMVDSLARSTEFKTLVIPMIPMEVWRSWEKMAAQSFEFIQTLKPQQLESSPDAFKHFVAEVRAAGRVSGEDLIALMLVGSQQGMLTMNHAPGVPAINQGQIDFLNRFMTDEQRSALAEKLIGAVGGKAKGAAKKSTGVKRAKS